MEQRCGRVYHSAAEYDELAEKIRRAQENGADTEEFTAEDRVMMLLCDNPELQSMWYELNLDYMVNVLKQEERERKDRLRKRSRAALRCVLPWNK